MKELQTLLFKKIHFIGIGGISMSGLAQMCVNRGSRVSGSDRADLRGTAIYNLLVSQGVSLTHVGHRKENVVHDTDLVVYSVAVPSDNQELVYARELGIKIMSRSQFLGFISEMYCTIAVCGTHGKTTTSAMITKVLKDACKDPTALVGSIMLEYGSNFVSGNSEYLVLEACEYEQQFLDIKPWAMVLTNIEADHLDYYKNLQNVERAFADFVALLPREGGALVYNKRDSARNVLFSAELDKLAKMTKIKAIDYSAIDATGLRLKSPGKHNIENAKATIALALDLGISKQSIIKSLNEFIGTERRFEYKGMTPSGAQVYDDYAHHPTEIRTTLAGAREKFREARIAVVFQPHLYSRTYDFLDEFSRSFEHIDEVIVTSIYPAREQVGEMLPNGDIVPSISGEDLVKKIKKPKAQYIRDFGAIAKYIKNEYRNGDLIIIMGAGDVYKLGKMLIAQ